MTTTPALWGSETTFSFDTSAFSPRVTGLADGSFAIVWESGGNVFGQHFDALGQAQGGDFLAQLSVTRPQAISNPHLIQQANGQVFVDFTEAAFGDDPSILRNAVAPNFGPSVTASPIDAPILGEILNDTMVRSDGADNFGSAIVYEFPKGAGHPETLLWLRFVSAGGQPVGNEIIVGQHDGELQFRGAVTGRHTGHVVVAYENFNIATEQRDVRLHSYAPDGTDTSGEVIVSAKDVSAGLPDLIAQRDGSYVVVWQQADGIAFRRYFAEATPIGGPQTISGSAGGLDPTVTALNDGGYIVAWVVRDGIESDGSADLDIALQRFDKVGATVGEKILFDKPGDQDVFSLNMTTLSDGRVVLSYKSETGDATNIHTLRYQIIDPRDEVITGDAADNSLIGRDQASTLLGLAGNDRLTGRAEGDTLDGGAGNDTLAGGAGNDRLAAGTGDDFVLAGVGNDRLTGGLGRDVLCGGLGCDAMSGNNGADIFDFNSVNDSSPAATTRDVIGDFLHAVDRIDFQTIDAKAGSTGNQTFAFIRASAFTAEGQLRAVQSGDNTVLQLNTEGTTGAEMAIVLNGVTAATLTAADFVL